MTSHCRVSTSQPPLNSGRKCCSLKAPSRPIAPSVHLRECRSVANFFPRASERRRMCWLLPRSRRQSCEAQTPFPEDWARASPPGHQSPAKSRRPPVAVGSLWRQFLTSSEKRRPLLGRTMATDAAATLQQQLEEEKKLYMLRICCIVF